MCVSLSGLALQPEDAAALDRDDAAWEGAVREADVVHLDVYIYIYIYM